MMQRGRPAGRPLRQPREEDEMYVDEIYAAAAELCGTESENLMTVCGAVKAQLEGRLRDGYSIEDCRDAFIMAAAVLAVEMYGDMTDLSSDVASYTAGSVTVMRQKKVGGNMKKQAETLLAPYLKDDGFAFRGVDGN